MAQLNWTNYEEPKEYEPDKPGVYTVRVATCEERVSKKGDTFFSVGLESTELGRIVAYDIIMLEGKGANIGLCKLERLGFTKDDGVINDIDLLNRKTIVHPEEEEYNGNKRLAMAFDFDDPFRAGYTHPSNYEELKGRIVVKEDGWPEPDPGPSEFDETPF